MKSAPKPPKAFQAFVETFPKIGQAWELVANAGRKGPLDEKTARLIKLAIAVGAMREGAVHASVRKARALGITPEEIHQVIALAAGTLGFPSTVAIHSWIADDLTKPKK